MDFTNAAIRDEATKNPVTVTGDTKVSTTQSSCGGSSIYFDGNGDYLSLPTSSNLQLGANDFGRNLGVSHRQDPDKDDLLPKRKYRRLGRRYTLHRHRRKARPKYEYEW